MKRMRILVRILIILPLVIYALGASAQGVSPVSATGEKQAMQSPEPVPKAAPAAVSNATRAATVSSECDGAVVAEVNRQPIYLKEITDITGPFEQNMVLVGANETRWKAIERVRKRYLDMLLNERLLTLAAGADPSVQPAEDRIEAEYQAQIQHFGDEESMLKANGATREELRARIAMKLAAQQLRQKNVIDRIQITPKMKEDYYLEHRSDKFTIPRQAAVRGLFRFADSDVEMASEERKIEEIRAEMEEALTGIEDKVQRLKVFSNFVPNYSEYEPTRFNGGFWYIYGGHHIPQEFWKFEDAAFEAPESELSPVTKLDRGYCLFMVDYKRPEYVKTFTEADTEIDRILQKELYERFQNQWKESIEKQFSLKLFGDRLMCGVPQEATGEVASATASATGN